MVFGYDFEMILDIYEIEMESMRFGYDFDMALIWFRKTK